MSSGVSDQGFDRKRLDEILQELNSEMKSIFGENLNLSPQSPDGQVNGVILESLANLWEIAEDVYNSFNPSAATGAALSNLVQFNGITRREASSSRVEINVTGTNGTSIPANSIVSTSDTGEQFATEDVILIESGVGSGYVNSVNTGPIEALPNTLTKINTPITGWSTCDNALSATLGSDVESDPDLRARRIRSIGLDSVSVIDSVLGALSALDGVTQVIVLENDTDFVDINGQDPHSFQAVVVGGVDKKIGQSIWLKKPAGIKSFGNTSTIITDSQGFPHEIGFSRPDTVDVYVTINLDIDSTYPSDGDDLIKQAIVDYANGILVEGRGFSLSDDVIYSRLFTPINIVQGHEIVSLMIGTSPNPTGTTNIPISVTEISNFLIANITVNS